MLFRSSTGANNTSVGYRAAISTVDGINNVCIGSKSDVDSDGSNSIVIGYNAKANASNQIRIGFEDSATPTPVQTSCFIDGIYSINTGGLAVSCTANGQISTAVSSARYKTDITPIDLTTAEIIYQLNPVTFYYKTDVSKNSLNYGLIAEEVEKVMPNLVHYKNDDNGNPIIESVYYQYITPLLITACKDLKTENMDLIKKMSHIEKRLAILEAMVV